jgi:hypothetical protein
MNYASNLQHPTRSLALLSMAAAVLGAGVATATFALVNIEDQPVVSSQTPAAVSATVPSDAVAGQRNDGGPAEGTEQQIIRPETAQAGTAATTAGSAKVGIPSPAAAAKMYGPVACGTAAVGIPSPAAAARMNEDCGSSGAP